MTRVKICGITNKEDAFLSHQLGTDYLGMILSESKRKITLEEAQSVINSIPYFNNFVGVFVNESAEMVESLAKQLKLRFLQFHGEESSPYCQYFSSKGFTVIKAIRVKGENSLDMINGYDLKYFLLDSFSEESYGGTGQCFDWNILKGRNFKGKRIMLSGGLKIDNVKAAIQTVRPFAVDVSSGVESKTGKKNFRLVQEFINIVKKDTSHAQS